MVDMLKRGHNVALLQKGFYKHLNKYRSDQFQRIPALKTWFKKMITWAYHDVKHFTNHEKNRTAARDILNESTPRDTPIRRAALPATPSVVPGASPVAARVIRRRRAPDVPPEPEYAVAPAAVPDNSGLRRSSRISGLPHPNYV